MLVDGARGGNSDLLSRQKEESWNIGHESGKPEKAVLPGEHEDVLHKGEAGELRPGLFG